MYICHETDDLLILDARAERVSEIAGTYECITWLILVLVALLLTKKTRHHTIDFRNQLTQEAATSLHRPSKFCHVSRSIPHSAQFAHSLPQTWLFDNPSRRRVRHRSAKLASSATVVDGAPPGNWDPRTRYLGCKTDYSQIFL